MDDRSGLRPVKVGLIAAAVLGLVGVFLPLDYDTSWWARREGPDGLGVAFVIGAFVLALGMGALSLRAGMQRWIALVAVICFGFVILKFRGAFLQLFTSQAGGMLIGAAAAIGIVLAGLAAWRPEPAR